MAEKKAAVNFEKAIRDLEKISYFQWNAAGAKVRKCRKIRY